MKTTDRRHKGIAVDHKTGTHWLFTYEKPITHLEDEDYYRVLAQLLNRELVCIDAIRDFLAGHEDRIGFFSDGYGTIN